MVAIKSIVLLHERQEEGCVVFTRDTKLRVYRIQATFSIANAMPIPPLTQRVARPRLAFLFNIS